MLSGLWHTLDPALFWEYRAILLHGMGANLEIFLGSAILAATLAFVIGLARLNRVALVRTTAAGYTELFRNTPEMVLIVWVYYVLPFLLSGLIGARLGLSPWLACVLALGFAYSGFMAETVRAGLLSVPRGQIEAASALGMARRTILFRIIAPQALRRMLPEVLNQFVSLFKATSIVSIIAVHDIMYSVSVVNDEEMHPLPLYTGAALLYCAVVILSSQVIQRLTRRWRRRGWA
jgi:polar amino acid transport system permease protein